jgi:hypothetical protein
MDDRAHGTEAATAIVILSARETQDLERLRECFMEVDATGDNPRVMDEASTSRGRELAEERCWGTTLKTKNEKSTERRRNLFQKKTTLHFD